ncbi:hypothetical protein BBJ28_00025282 [Nothophytophthora sp. Chile5]|nr:hypothetical protein BBJ28_00025282 [Nothophytophthora sp. Chile5]
MPLFSRSSERKSRPKSHRFSFRKHQPDAAEASSSVFSSSGSGHSHSLKPQPRGPSAPPTTRAPERTIVVAATKPKPPPSALSSSARSSASTLRSTSPTIHEALSGGENDTELSEDAELRDSVDTTLPPQRESRMRNSRNSLAEYRQLQCSMSYKNRLNSDAYRAATGDSARMSDLRASMVDSVRPASSSARASDGHASKPYSPYTASASASARMSEPVPSSASARPSEAVPSARMTEASVAALQTRRAFQQMVLAMEDDESGDEDYESDSDALRVSSSADSSTGNSGVVRLGADEYRKFQFRLRQLEELSAEQARKQADMERTIEQEVQSRTRKVVAAMERQISMYKQAKELECEREVQRRLSEQMDGSRRSSRASRQSSVIGRGSTLPSVGSVGSFRDSYSIGIAEEKGKPLEKLLHPRRSRMRLEQMREREMEQKREMEQFREFIRSTELRATQVQVTPDMGQAAVEKLRELADPMLSESLVQAPPSELVELVCVLRRHSRVQEQQLEEAKGLVTAAIEAREEAETTAREAVELTLLLDARLDRAAREEHKLLRQARKLSAADEFRTARRLSATSSQSSDWQFGTPAAPSLLE